MTLSDAEKRHIQRMENSIAAMTPTQEQIEAAAKALHKNCDVDSKEPCTFCIDAAEAALTAAAGVGDKPQATFPHGTLLVNATIERCAQWLDDNGFYAGALAMRRALKGG